MGATLLLEKNVVGQSKAGFFTSSTTCASDMPRLLCVQGRVKAVPAHNLITDSSLQGREESLELIDVGGL